MSCCQFVSPRQLAIIIEQLRSGQLSEPDRAEHERFLRKCVPHPDIMILIEAPTMHPANPNPGVTPTSEELAHIAIGLRG